VRPGFCAAFSLKSQLSAEFRGGLRLLRLANQRRLIGSYFLEPRLIGAARAADASRDTIWQGNCDVADLQLRSNIAPIRNTIPIQYPISNCPAKKGFLQTALSKARRTTVFRHTSFVDARFR
jgi:hypothetical protein